MRRIIAGIYQTFLFVLGLALWLVKMAVYLWSGCFLVIVGGLAFLASLFLTLCAFTMAMYALKLFSGV